MVIVAVQDAAFMQLSVAVKVTILAPKFPQLKVVLLKLRLTIPQLSALLLLTAAALVDTVPALPRFKLIFLQLVVGLTVSLTKIVLETETKVLPQMSLAVQVSRTCPLQFPEIIVANVDKFEVPLIWQLPPCPFENDRVLADGSRFEQVTVMLEGAVIVGNAAGLTVMNLETEVRVLPQMSVPVQVSVIVPPHAPDGVCALKVEAFEVPLIRQPPLKALLKGIILEEGLLPQAIVIGPGAVIVGKAAVSTVIVPVAVLEHPPPVKVTV
jgi:hypothetical protein